MERIGGKISSFKLNRHPFIPSNSTPILSYPNKLSMANTFA
jgi:hypothetical protein